MLDVNGTREATVGGKVWRLRPLPFAVVLECQARESAARQALQRASVVDGGVHVPLDDSPEARAAFQAAIDGRITADARSRAEALRWGLRAYATDANGENANVDGRTYRVLSPDAVSALAAWGGAVAVALADEVMRRDALSADDLLGFLQPSGS
jgi:hypothetical protein